MTRQELYLKTMFCCIACDGEIAPEETQKLQELAQQTPFLASLDITSLLAQYVTAIQEEGATFLRKYLHDLSQENLSVEEGLQLINVAIAMIDADERETYSEIKFFKKLRAKLTNVTDEQILALHPDKEDLLLPDIAVADEPLWDELLSFANIHLA